MDQRHSDEELAALIETRLRTALLCDAMDELGLLSQAMAEWIRPLAPKVDQVIAGRAATALFVDVHQRRDNPYEQEIAFVDSLQPGDVAVVATNCSRSNGVWGELMSTAARTRGAKATVTDGLCRDMRQIVELDYAVYCAGLKPVDSAPRGLLIEHDTTVMCGQVRVHPGDWVVLDIDGVCVIPQEAADKVIRSALDKASREQHTKRELAEGAYLRDVYDKYGVL
ncbi:MAG TPA: RraA family protein [Phycisphaerae bacterium]|nr:RraA family protein [Phycisphaerae bacterium]